MEENTSVRQGGPRTQQYYLPSMRQITTDSLILTSAVVVVVQAQAGKVLQGRHLSR